MAQTSNVMKTLLKFVALAMTAITLSCQKADDVTKEQNEVINVSFGFSGEIYLSETPMTKANDAKDWYAFQVYYRPQGSSERYERYAYGFFDNKEEMIIALKSEYEYKFDVSMAVDGSEKVYSFSLDNAGWTGITNSFIVSSTESVRYMYEGHLLMRSPYEQFDRPAVDRFFGRVEGFVPTEGACVNINMKRVAFGAKFVPSNFTEGSLEINIEGSKTLTMTAGEQTTIEEIISFYSIGAAYEDNAYSENIPINIVWVKPDGVRTPIVSETINFKRNILTTIKFEVKDLSSTNSFNITTDDDFDGEEDITANQDGTNTEVNPQ